MKLQIPFLQIHTSLFITFLLLINALGCAANNKINSTPLSSSSENIKTKENNREEQVHAYLKEFVGLSMSKSYPQIFQAIKNALYKLPDDAFAAATNRNRPVIFLVSITSGIARFAHSREFIVEENDPPVFQEGFFIIELGDELNHQEDVEAIEGIILHEIAHRVLEHLRKPSFNCNMEREANRLIKSWGYTKEYEKASEIFGAKKKGDSPCNDKLQAEKEKQLTDAEKN